MLTAIIIWVIVILLFLSGLSGLLIPFLPGLPLIFSGTLIYAIFTDFREITVGTVILFAALTILSFLMDYLAGVIGAKKFGASKMGIIGAFFGTLVGLLSLGIFGIIIGPFLGALIFELLSGRPQKEAIKVGTGVLVGFLAGALFNFILGFLMIGLFTFKIIF